MDKQRIYDAMLIRAFRMDKTTGVLWHWLKVYKIEVPDPELKRQPPKWNMRIQTFVGHYLKPLADRLWDTEPSQDIATLDWMANLECKRTGNRERENLARKSNNDRRRGGLLNQGLERMKASNQWHVTKSKTKTGRKR